MSTPELIEELVTGEELYAMGDIGPCELVEGKIVEMSPTKPQHGRLESRIDHALSEFVRAHNLGEIMVGEVGIYTGRDPDTIRAADVLYISHERYAQATPDSFLDVPPELVVEVLSPSDRWSEIRNKLREYFAFGINVVVIVEPDVRIVSVYRAPTEIEELTEEAVLTLEDILPGFALPLQELFGAGR